MVIKEATTPEPFLRGRNHTIASCLHWLFIYDSKCLGNKTAINGTVFVEGGVMSSWDTPHPTPVSTVSNALRIAPQVFQPVDLGPAKSSSCGLLPRLPARLPGTSLAVTWCLPSRQTPQSSAHLHHLWRPLPTKPLAASKEAKAPSRLRHICSALLNDLLDMGTPSPFIFG